MVYYDLCVTDDAADLQRAKISMAVRLGWAGVAVERRVEDRLTSADK
jgi:hypothetical protein